MSSTVPRPLGFYLDGNSFDDSDGEENIAATHTKPLACAFCSIEHPDLMPCGDCGKTHYCSTLCYNEHVALEHGKICIARQ